MSDPLNDEDEHKKATAERKRAQIERINGLSQLARTSWLVSLGYLALTLLRIKDADFFSPSREIQMPVVNIPLNAATLLIFSSIIVTGFYLYFHSILERLLRAIDQMPRDEAEAGEDYLGETWLATWVLERASVRANRPFLYTDTFVSFLLLWAAAPTVLLFAWWRSMPAHDVWLTLLLGISFALPFKVGLQLPDGKAVV